MNVYKYEKWTAVKVPVCKIGDKFTPKKLLMVEGRTTPPEPINESDLITEMDKNGIGTDATIARYCLNVFGHSSLCILLMYTRFNTYIHTYMHAYLRTYMRIMRRCVYV